MSVHDDVDIQVLKAEQHVLEHAYQVVVYERDAMRRLLVAVHEGGMTRSLQRCIASILERTQEKH